MERTACRSIYGYCLRSKGVIDFQVQVSRSEPGGREGDFSSGFSPRKGRREVFLFQAIVDKPSLSVVRRYVGVYDLMRQHRKRKGWTVTGGLGNRNAGQASRGQGGEGKGNGLGNPRIPECEDGPEILSQVRIRHAGRSHPRGKAAPFQDVGLGRGSLVQLRSGWGLQLCRFVWSSKTIKREREIDTEDAPC
ncbi:uncharacterized protein CCOS01_05597 [Colletotrichum costaricense]|uniref:Uncharacterized protein n=1 Tax=Colletotrichum costaricense TaxID=1209916 RepID=A0AAI9Z0T8_9PEZI|nr:uncharacterized protein CCOS01_05597 [Colletotrichum costaricense]KAK1530494.1 hypothetical protein CCOS01_05597 [Colletotrichum costaricense]